MDSVAAAQMDNAGTALVVSSLSFMLSVVVFIYTVWKHRDQVKVVIDCKYVGIDLTSRAYRIAVYNTGNKPVSIKRASIHFFKLDICEVGHSLSCYDGTTHDEEMVLMPGAKKAIAFNVSYATLWPDHVEVELQNGSRFCALVQDTCIEHLIVTALAFLIASAVHLADIQHAILVRWDTNQMNQQWIPISSLFDGQDTRVLTTDGNTDVVYERMVKMLPRLFLRKGNEYRWTDAVAALVHSPTDYSRIAAVFGLQTDDVKKARFKAWVDSRPEAVRGRDVLSKSFF